MSQGKGCSAGTRIGGNKPPTGQQAASGLPAKLSRPRARTLLPRERIFEQLDGSGDRKWTWIGAPAGSGKTALAASWIEARKWECLWYQIDAGDGDPATFFHYLTVAGLHVARKRHVLLPPLTPEYLPGLHTYACRFFEQLFQLYLMPFVLVLDNLHEVANDAPLVTVVIPALLDSLPSLGRVLCMSRTVLPPALVRNSTLVGFQELKGEDLRLTDAEAVHLARQSGVDDADYSVTLNCSVNGWVTGLKLLLRATAEEKDRLVVSGHSPPQVLFDYYAMEVFARAPMQLRNFLMRAALLPEMEAETVAAVTGRPDAAVVLAQLHAEQLFTERRLLPNGPSYQFHFLFRNYLLAELGRVMTTAQIAELKKQCIDILEVRGQLEAATALAMQCDEPEMLTRLILSQAPQLARQGRLATLEAWITRIPAQSRENNGWLLYWLGFAYSLRDPILSQATLHRSYDQFCTSPDQPGAWLAVASIVHSHFVAFGKDPDQAWAWVDVFESLRSENGGCLPEPVEVQVLALLQPMAGHCPEHVLSRHIVARALTLSPQLKDPEQRRGIGGIAVAFLIWQGHESAARALIDELESGRCDYLPISLATLSFDMWRGILFWTRSEHERAFDTLIAARKRASQAGLEIFDCLLCSHLTLAALSAGDMSRADNFLRQMLQAIRPFQTHMRHFARAIQAMQWGLAGQAGAGAALATELLISAEFTDAPSSDALLRSFLTVALLEGGELDEAERCGLQMLQLAARLPSDRWLFDGHMLLAGVELERGAEPAALDRLKAALRIASFRNFRGGVSLWQPVRTARLLGIALRDHIEADQVTRIIQWRKLKAPADLDLEVVWPVYLRVRALGPLEILIDGECVADSSLRAARKPLEILKLLIGLGPKDISLERISALLWPDLDGAAAHNACHVAIHRLRKVLRSESAVIINHGVVSLDSELVGADVERFRKLAGRIRASLAPDVRQRSELENLTARLLAAYPDHFLPGEESSWAIGVREQLKAQFLNLVNDLSESLSRAGAVAATVSLNRRGIELAPLAEACHRGLIRGLIELGRKAEALEAFRHCRAVLLSGLRVEPSAEIYALCARIRQLE